MLPGHNDREDIDIVDAAMSENGSVLIYGGTTLKEKPQILQARGKFKVGWTAWFPGNGFIAELVPTDGLPGNFSWSLIFHFMERDITLSLTSGDLKLYADLGGDEKKRHRARAILTLKREGPLALYDKVRAYLGRGKAPDYQDWLRRAGFLPLLDEGSFNIPGYVLAGIPAGTRLSSSMDHRIRDALDKREKSGLPAPLFIYTDTDTIGRGEEVKDPVLKPDFDPFLLDPPGLFDGGFLIDRDLYVKLGGRSMGWGPGSDSLLKEEIERAGSKGLIMHVPGVLLHIPKGHDLPAAGPVDQPDGLQKRAGAGDDFYPDERPLKVSVIIPNKDHIGDLDRCIRSVTRFAGSMPYEIIVVENNSTEKRTDQYYRSAMEKYPPLKVIRWEKGFNYSAINNYGVKASSGDLILLLNNDTAVKTENFLAKMAAFCHNEGTGAVGGKLLYPDGTIQHAGVCVGLNGTADHLYQGMPGDARVRLDLIRRTHLVSAVTGACLMVKRSLWDEVQGMNEDLQVNYNDVDFCLRLQEKGYRNIYLPEVVLMHDESKTRGSDFFDHARWRRFRRETCYMEARFHHILSTGDPYYNRYLTLSGLGGGLCQISELPTRSER